MRLALLPSAAIVAVIVVAATSGAQPSAPAPAPTSTPSGEATVLIPPQGGTADIPVRFSSNVLLTFPSALAPRVVQSSPDWVVRDFADSVVARAVTPAAQPTTLALATANGAIQVNITLRLVPESADALVLVRFQSATAEEAFRAAVEAEVARRTAAGRAELARARAAIDADVRARADRLVADRLLVRLDVQRVKAHARDDDNVILHGERVIRLGDAAYVTVELENRSPSAYRLATVALRDRAGLDRAAAVAVVTTASGAPDPGLLGVIPAGTSGHAAIAVRDPGAILGEPLRLEIAEPNGARRVVIDRGLSIR